MAPSGKQIRAARILAGWDRSDLAEKSGVSIMTLQFAENDERVPKPKTMEKIVKAFEDAGIEFLDNEGVRRRNDTLRVLEGKNSYLEVLEDVFLTLRETEGEVLFAFVRNKLSPPEVIESDLRLRHLGIRFRSLIEEGDTYCLYPLNEYRVVPKQSFHNNVQVIYGDKVATMLSNDKRAIIVRDVGFTDTQRKIFNLVWDTHTMPTKSTAPKTYE